MSTKYNSEKMKMKKKMAVSQSSQARGADSPTSHILMMITLQSFESFYDI